MQLTAIAFSVLLAACGGKSKPAEPANSEPPATTDTAGSAATPMESAACTEQGGQVRGDIGDGQIKCAEDEETLGRVNQGIEGAICCRGK
jgi:hypothetical protein